MSVYGKQALRKEARRKRNALGAEASRADSMIFRRFCRLSEYNAASVIFCFIGTDGEINTMPLIEKAIADGKRVCVPKCAAGGVMDAFGINGVQDLRPGRFGIPEPQEHCALIKPEEIGLAAVPCMACDRNGTRLGRGGGYYDRYLAGQGFTTAAICYETLLFDEIPAEEHDICVDIVVTELGVYRRG